jgi:hypothetical protein
MPDFPYCKEAKATKWSNYHGTVKAQRVPLVVTPDIPGEIGTDAPRKFKRCGKALSDVVGYAMANGKTLRTVGARWSLSRIIEPGDIVVDPGYLNKILRVRPSFLSEKYRTERLTKGFVPVFAQGGTTVRSLNASLGDIGLALRTSGASDGHRIAGCIATGTHGSAFGFGAVHDSVLGVHLIVAKDKALFIVPKKNAALGPELGEWLEEETGIPTETMKSNALFGAAQVHLGALGIVHGVVLEAEPLYKLQHRILPMQFDDPKLWRAIETLDTKPLHPDTTRTPFHFEVVFSPYPPRHAPGAYVSLMWKQRGKPPAISPPPKHPALSSDLFDMIATLSRAMDGPFGAFSVEALVNQLLGTQYVAGHHPARFPGEVFGPTRLPPGKGASTEIAVDHVNSKRMLDAIFRAVGAESHVGRHHLGAFGVRFAPKGTSLMGMNQSAMTTYIEMGGIDTDESMPIFRRAWAELDADEIPFTTHWGQLGELKRERVAKYFGQNVARWKEARAEILPTKKARKVFATPVLTPAGLG